MDYVPIIPRTFAAMIAPKVSRRFHNVLSMIGLRLLFSGAEQNGVEKQ